MRTVTVRALHVVAVVLSFAMVLEGPDLLLFAVAEPVRWLVVGGVSALVTLPLLRWRGVGLVPPWTMPAFGADTPFRRLAVYHLVDGVTVAWLWTTPTVRVVQWLHVQRGFHPGTAVDVTTTAAGVALAELLFILPALLVLLRLSAYRTGIDLAETHAREVLRPLVVAVGSYLFVAWCLVVASVALGASVR